MLQKIDKKKYIFFYLITFLILSSIHNSNFKSNNFFSIKKIDVVGLNKSKNILLENKLVDFIGYNIFTLEKESFKFINSLNFIKDYNIKKIYPNKLKVYLEPGEAVITNSTSLFTKVLDVVNNEIDIGINNYRWYIFNMADTFITIGIIIYFILQLKNQSNATK